MKYHNSPYWAVCVGNGVLYFRCSDGRSGSEPFTVDGFNRLSSLIGANGYEVIGEKPPISEKAPISTEIPISTKIDSFLSEIQCEEFHS